MKHAFIQYSRRGRSLVLLLCITLTYVPSMLAQAAGPGRTLKVVVLDGDNAMNKTGTRTAVQPVVEVRNEDDRTLSGVTVIFQLPSLGPGALFPDDKLEQQTLTNTQGQASTKGMVPNIHKGQFHINVTAKLGNRTGTATITQQNVDAIPEKKQTSSRWWKYTLILGAAGAAGAVAAGLSGGGNGSGPTAVVTAPPLTITPGNISIGGPR